MKFHSEYKLEKAAFIIYMFIIVLSPLLFGAVHTYAYTVMIIGVLTGNLLLIKYNIRKNLKTGQYQFHCYSPGIHLFCLIILAFLVFQVVPLPGSLLEILSPESLAVGQKAIPASHIAGSDNPGNEWFSISGYYYPVRLVMNRWCVYALFLIGLVQVLNSRKRVEQILLVILMTGCFEALYGLMQTYSVSNHIWWYKKSVNILSVTGTYLNPNHFAGFMELCLLLAAAYAAAISKKEKKKGVPSTSHRRLRIRLSRFLSHEQQFAKQLFILVSGIVVGLGLVFSASRGGMIAASGGLLLMGVVFVLKQSSRRNGIMILVLFLAILINAFYIGADYPFNRFARLDHSIQYRLSLVNKTIDMFNDHQLAGVGVGNYQYVFPRYQTAENRNKFFRHAHNDWIQFFAEAGLMGACLFLIGIVIFINSLTKIWKKRRDPFAVSLGLLSLCAIAAMAIHSYTDFNLHIPANTLLLVAIIAIGHNAVRLNRNHGKGAMLGHHATIPFRYKGAIMCCLIIGIIIWNGVWAFRHFMAEAYCNTVRNSTLHRNPNPTLQSITKAISWDPYNAEFWWKLALEKGRSEDMNMEMTDKNNRERKRLKIIHSLEQAISLNPFNAWYHLKLGMEAIQRAKKSDLRRKWLSTGDISIERAAYFAGESDPNIHVRLGNYWVIRSKMTSSFPDWDVVWQKASWHYLKAQDIDGSQSLKNKIRAFVWHFYPDREMIQQVIRP